MYASSTMYAPTYTGGNMQLSSTMSAATLVGTDYYIGNLFHGLSHNATGDGPQIFGWDGGSLAYKSSGVTVNSLIWSSAGISSSNAQFSGIVSASSAIATSTVTAANIGASSTVYASTFTGSNMSLSGNITATNGNLARLDMPGGGYNGIWLAGNWWHASSNTMGMMMSGGHMIWESDTQYNMVISNSLKAASASNTLGNIFTTGGNVGVGIVAPAYKLEVDGMIAGTGFSGSNIQLSSTISAGTFRGQFMTVGSLNVTGESILGGAVTAGALNITGQSILQGTVTAGALTVTGASFMNTLNVTNQGTFGSLMVNTVNMTPSLGDIFKELSFSFSNNVATPTVITDFDFDNGTVRSFEAQVSVTVIATNTLYAVYKILGIQKDTTVIGRERWYINTSYVGENCGITFSIDSNGQILYTTNSISGFVSGTLKVRCLTTSI